LRTKIHENHIQGKTSERKRIKSNTNGRIQASVIKLSIFLTKSTPFKKAVSEPVRCWVLDESVLGSKLGAVTARYYARHGNAEGHHTIDHSICPACYKILTLLYFYI
jgi:hypothetical protein